MIKLSEISTIPPEGLKKDDVKKEFEDLRERIADLQTVMAAEGKYSLLVVFQGMDSSGKDGVSRKVFKECSPVTLSVRAFKKPSDEEFAHDFLWRVHKYVPQKGHIQLFNRSHYEDILIQRVHNWIDEDLVDARIKAINAFEDLLWKDNKTVILKFFLYLSKDEQERELKQRISEPEKNYKHRDGDWEERRHWDRYMFCYEEAINRCNVHPWTIVPADDEWYRNYVVAKKIVETLEALDMKMPLLDKSKIDIGIPIDDL
ncbi:MAG: PPK2 family polyphosphate kinase [Bacteroidota bacterium]